MSHLRWREWKASRWATGAVILAALACVLGAGAARAAPLDVQVLDAQTGAAVTDYRWVLEEDVNYFPTPGVIDAATGYANTVSLQFHKSYMPAVAKGDTRGVNTAPDLDPLKRYFVSALPYGGYAMSGAPVAPGQTAVTIYVNPLPLPTAQIAVHVFHDVAPTNNAPDDPAEPGLPNFRILLEDAGGRYGASAGQMFQDVYGNLLGTTYVQTCDADGANPGTGVYLCRDGGVPVVDVLGDGIIRTDANGNALIKNLAPGKYGVIVVPPEGDAGWIQTTTIEGTQVNDAWVKANEPPVFVEFGPAGPHVFFGFVKEFVDGAALTGTSTLTGTVMRNHMSRPPVTDFFPSAPWADVWVALNTAAGTGPAIWIGKADPATGAFSIPGVAPGSYQLAFWDANLDMIFAFYGVTVNADGSCVNAASPGSCNFGTIAANNWFAHFQGSVFNDINLNGFRDPGESGIPEQNINIRWRDGTIYQQQPTDIMGEYAFDEVFPFFNWLVVEVDFARYKATGATIVVDAGGGPTDPAYDNKLVPQVQAVANPNTGDALSRTEVGEVLTQGYQAFLGQTNQIDWGKVPYTGTDNGGISGLVYYTTTRAEDDPRSAGAEVWEPGIPRVQMALYNDVDGNGVIDELDGDGLPTRADVDNQPQGDFPGPGDVDRDADGVFDAGDAVQITYTDSFDDSVPTDCPPNQALANPTADPFYFGGKCYDGLRNFNQVRPAVFDGGYLFASYVPTGLVSGAAEVSPLPPGTYIVEAAREGTVYEVQKEEDKNVDFGETYTAPTLLALPPLCVGEPHLVPDVLALFPDEGIAPVAAGLTRPLCDLRQVNHAARQNTPAEFFFFTETPVAAHIKGMILNDLANEFDPANPVFGEKFAPAWVPISVRDWTGRELTRAYTDEFGQFNILVPSTFTTNIPSFSGMSPNMLTACMNDPGPVPDPANPGQLVTDPFFQRQYSQFCYTFQYMPGTVTYLDTPVVPVAAFASQNAAPLDCQFPSGTPIIYSAERQGGNGPYVDATSGARTLEIVAQGPTTVSNPIYDPSNLVTPQTVVRDYGFGTAGTVTLGGTPLENVTWTAGLITGEVPAGMAPGRYQLTVTRSDNGLSTVTAATVVVGPVAGNVIEVGAGGTFSTIQAAIDSGSTVDGDLILVAPGTYDELVIVYKDVEIQGSGAPSTVVLAAKVPAEKLLAWQQKAAALVAGGQISFVPGQGAFITEEGPGFFVGGSTTHGISPKIDGFTVTGSDQAGGIIVNGYAAGTEISNNSIHTNNGFYGGGIRVGAPFGDAGASDAQNDGVLIHHNHVFENGMEIPGGAGGGIALYTGTDGYQVTDNYVCGNFAVGDGGGIGHLGLSNGGLIARNKILFNQSFYQLFQVNGGGLFIGGLPVAGGLTAGAGSVIVDRNLIQGNNAGAGDGAGIQLQFVNGADVAASPSDAGNWYTVGITNNMIVNNVAGLAAGGIALQDATRVTISHNTIAHNDSTATAGGAFAGAPNASTAQPAGVVSRAHTPALSAVLPPARPRFSNPVMVNDIIWRNRSFSWDVALGLVPDAIANPGAVVYSDLAVLGAVGSLNPRYSILTSTAGYHGSNSSGDPRFGQGYFNGGASGIVSLVEFTTGIQTAPALDEGGNFIDIQYAPLSPAGNYHIAGGSPAINSGTDVGVAFDFDGGARDGSPDRGADEYLAVSGLVLAAEPVSPQLHTTSVTFTASAAGGTGQFEYRFLKRVPGGTEFVEVQPFSTDNTWVWATTVADAGTSRIVVQARSVGSVLPTGETQTAMNYTIYGPATGVLLFALPQSPKQVGVQVTFTGVGQGGSGTYEYRFLKRVPGGTTFVEMQPYSTDNTWAWDTTVGDVGTSRIVVQVRNLGSAALQEAQTGINYRINP